MTEEESFLLDFMKQNFLFDEDGDVYWAQGRRKGHPVGNWTEKGYLRVKVCGKNYRLHRLVWLFHKGRLPELDLDHKDRNKGNNKIDNLREATPSQNSSNCGPRRDCERGVYDASGYSARNPWRVMIRRNNEIIHSSLHSTYEEACEVAKSIYSELKDFE